MEFSLRTQLNGNCNKINVNNMHVRADRSSPRCNLKERGRYFYFYYHLKTTCFFVSKIILQNVASCYAFYKDYSKASVYFKKLVDLQPDNEGVIADYGRVLAMSGKVDEAKEQLRNALKIAEKKNQEQLVEQVYFSLY